MKIYVEYNIFAKLDTLIEGGNTTGGGSRQTKDYADLALLWQSFKSGQLHLVTCEDDCLMEFIKYDRAKLKKYGDVGSYLTSHMKRKYAIFRQVQMGPLKIAPWGEYGFGRGPWGGGQKEHSDLLDKLCIMLDKQGATGQKDRDARHLLHCILYGCDCFLTMDYKTIVSQFKSRYYLIQPFMERNGYSLCVKSPSELLATMVSTL